MSATVTKTGWGHMQDVMKCNERHLKCIGRARIDSGAVGEKIKVGSFCRILAKKDFSRAAMLARAKKKRTI